MSHIPINKPSITDLEVNYVDDAIRNGWGENCYNYINRFENLFSNHINSKFSVATSSCTGAIHLSLLALGIGKGDEVIVPEITWVASVEPVIYVGAKPVLVDVLKDSWCIDPNAIERAITKKTKAIIAVHLYGNVCEMDLIMDLAKKYNLKVIEDAAEGIGSEYNSKKVGSIGDVGVFSFHGTKTITTGEGGMIVTDSAELAKKVRILNDHGRNPEDPQHKVYWMRDYGYKYKISNIQSAIGCAQVERINELINKKREIFSWYEKLFSDFPVTLNITIKNGKNGYWLPTIIYEGDQYFDPYKLIAFSKKQKVDIRPFFCPLSSLPFLDKVDSNQVAYQLYNRGVNLPSYHEMSYDDCSKVFDVVSSYFKKNQINE